MAGKKTSRSGQTPRWMMGLIVAEIVWAIFFLPIAGAQQHLQTERNWVYAMYGAGAGHWIDGVAMTMYSATASHIISFFSNGLDKIGTTGALELKNHVDAMAYYTFAIMIRLVSVSVWFLAMIPVIVAVVMDALGYNNIREYMFEVPSPWRLKIARRSVVNVITDTMAVCVFPLALPPFMAPLPLIMAMIMLHMGITNIQKV